MTRSGSRSCAHRHDGSSSSLVWPEGTAAPRWRLIEAWTVAAHGPVHGRRGRVPAGVLVRGPPSITGRGLTGRWPATPGTPTRGRLGFPAAAIAAFAHFLARHTPRQDGPEHGMAYDVQRFNELTKQMSAYAHVTRAEHAARAAARARRRAELRALAEQTNLRLRFRVEGASAGAAGARPARQRAPGPPGGRAAAVCRRRARGRLASSASSASRPGRTPARLTGATAPPCATPSGGACRSPAGTPRRRRERARRRGGPRPRRRAAARPR